MGWLPASSVARLMSTCSPGAALHKYFQRTQVNRLGGASNLPARENEFPARNQFARKKSLLARLGNYLASV